MNWLTKKENGIPKTLEEEWEDNNGNGGKDKFKSNYSNLCLVSSEEGLQVAKYDGDRNEWVNHSIGYFDKVNWWVDLGMRD